MNLYNGYQDYLNRHEWLIFHHHNEAISYRFFGKGEKTILMLLGSSMFSSDAYYKLLEGLESDYQIITIQYPKASITISMIVQLLKDLLSYLSVSPVYVLGASHGGGLAQAFAKEEKNLVKGLILYNTLTKTKNMNAHSKEIIVQVLEAIEQLKELRKIMPLFQIKEALLSQIEEVLIDKNDIELFESLISEFNEEDEKLQMELIKDLLINYEFEQDDFNYLDQRVMVLYGHDDDPFGGTELIESLAQVLTNPTLEFIEADRFSLVLDPSEMIKKIKEFIK
ncbi:MAG: alpha/beta hydrolase [Acholeplasmataceae bacterium]|nr:alpha/beta hydrolase [Acholeplasmataceae bacterium]